MAGKGNRRTNGGQQVHSDQTNVVKGQNSKNMVTTSIIRRPLPCPERGDRKIGEEHEIEQKESKKQGKKKKIREKTENKES